MKSIVAAVLWRRKRKHYVNRLQAAQPATSAGGDARTSLIKMVLLKQLLLLHILHAEAVFEELKRRGMKPTMKSHMLLLSAYSKSGNIQKCEAVINQMLKSGLKPDTFVLNSLLNAYGKMGHLCKMEQVLDLMEKGPFQADITTYNTLINIYGKAGFFSRMEELFQSLTGKKVMADVVTWTSRMGAYSRKKQYAKCLEIFEEMVDAGCYPDGGTARVLLSSCSSEQEVEEVSVVIRTMHKDVNSAVSQYPSLV